MGGRGYIRYSPNGSEKDPPLIAELLFSLADRDDLSCVECLPLIGLTGWPPRAPAADNVPILCEQSPSNILLFASSWQMSMSRDTGVPALLCR